jgi:methionine biosynthesis protein MetW
VVEQRTVRPDHEAIAGRVRQGARVLDVGCGDGALLDLLKSSRGVDARGLELSSETAGIALARGLSVIQGDADSDLELFPDDSFDVAILSQAVQ